MLGTDSLKFLEDIGCCRRCILVYLGVRTDALYGGLAAINSAIREATEELNTSKEEIDNCSKDCNNSEYEENHKLKKTVTQDPNETCMNTDGGGIVPDNGTPAHVIKKQKCAVCLTCIGLLQWGCSADAVKLLNDSVSQAGHDAECFTLALSFPVSLSLRVHWVWALLLQAYPHFPTKGRDDHVGTIKDVWKNVVGPQVAEVVGKTFIVGPYQDFVLNVTSTYIHDLEDCKIMDQLCGSIFAARQKQHRKYSNGIYSKQAVDTAIKKLPDQEFLKVCPSPPSIPDEAVSFSSLQCQQAPLYMAGRYNKYSRDLPQTPWFVEGERKLQSSVQELLCERLSQAVCADDVKFSSSGREDVDVRCLGNGRPFVFEFINPCRSKFSRADLIKLQNLINGSTSLIHLRDLQIVDRKDIKNLKEGEEEKTKAYCALCVSRKGYNPAILERLTTVPELTLQQKTPLRVLHRRPLATRPRVIHSMKASPVDDNFFKLHLTTQAGTYIKEFVHGDFGRTSPDLGSILGLEVDIVALDVEVRNNNIT
ncbi:tRNA pseudouridine synthase Pus10 isoform X1 [Procambarus clarkii]|uniref:tRNA pseudouridine synthase Pus10 isoform X1 n=2 Tax=Procambarus clarkii TaxID=6728 RepID=UPI003744336D